MSQARKPDSFGRVHAQGHALGQSGQSAVHSRRAFLRQAAALGALGPLGSLAPHLAANPLAATPKALVERKTKHLVLIAFAGGVRSRETFGAPANIPNLQAMADDGVLYPRSRTANLGHYGAALSLFTGISEARGIRENTRGTDPTVFEYLRKDLNWAANQVWVSTSGGPQQTNYSYGLHPEYGAPYGANTLDGDGIFNAEFKAILDSFGRPKDLSAEQEGLLKRMRSSIGGDSAGASREAALAAEDYRNNIENYILDELTRGTSDIRGANAADAKAIRVARNLLTIFKPAVTSIVLQQADIAHGSFNGYTEIIRQNDAAIGDLWKAVLADPELRDSTSFVVLPEFGRDADLNARRGLDHGDSSDDLKYVSTLCWGPDFQQGKVVTKDVRTIDACATVCDLFGAKARFSRGKTLPNLYR